MKKMWLLVLSLFVMPYVVYGQSATTRNAGQDFPPLTSGIEFSTVVAGEVHSVKLAISTEAKFHGRIISDEGWTALSDDDKWQVAVYQYIYRFENNSDEKLNILFTNHDVLVSSLPEIFGNYSLILKPREIKVVKFVANTRVREAYGGNVFFSLWDGETQRWHLFGGSAASLYVPGFNAFYDRE